MMARIIFLLILCTSLGCERGPEMVPVTGTISFQGKPLSYGSVMFQPVGVEGARTARSQIDSDGSFALTTEKAGDGVAAGTCHVRITAFESQRPDATVNKQQEMALGRSAIPQRYQNFGTSGIVIEVSNGMDLPLTIELQK